MAGATVNHSTTQRLVRGAALLSLVPAVPAGLLAVLIALNSVNPLQTAFVAEFLVRNASGEPLRFWVAGENESSQVQLLPLFATELPAFPSYRRGAFRLVHQGEARIVYDWDDVTFTVIVVERETGELRALDVDTQRRGQGCCRPPATDTYTIPEVSGLRPVSSAEAAILIDGVFAFRLALIFLLPLASIALFAWSRRLGRSRPTP